MYSRVNFEVHSGYGGLFMSIPVRSGPFLLVNAPPHISWTCLWDIRVHLLNRMDLYQGFTPSWMFGGPWDSTLNMIGVPSLKLGVPSFYISFEFWKVVHPSMKAQCCLQVSNFEGHVWPPSDFFWGGGGHLKILRATYYHQWNTIIYSFFNKSWTCPYNMQGPS